jgi:hypothetical protein
MSFEVLFPHRSPEDELLDSVFADLKSAIQYAAWGMDNYPHLLAGWKDVAVVREYFGSVVASVTRVDDEFMLVKDTNDPKYILDFLGLDHELFITDDGMQYTIYQRWDAVDA